MVPLRTNELKAERARNGLRQEDVAAALGITKANYSKKEKGVIRFTGAEMVGLMKLFRISIDQANDIFFPEIVPIGNEYCLRTELKRLDHD